MALSKYLVPVNQLTSSEYVFRMNLDLTTVDPTTNPEVKSIYHIICALLNSCGGVIQVRDSSGKMASNEKFDIWQNKLADRLQNFIPQGVYADLIKTGTDSTNGHFIKVGKSKTFITVDSHMFARGLAETFKITQYDAISQIVSKPSGLKKLAGSLIDLTCQDLQYGAKLKCFLTEREDLEFKHSTITTLKDLRKIMTGSRYMKTLFALANLGNGGDLIMGITNDGIVFGQVLDEKDEKVFKKMIATDILGQLGSIWGSLSVTPTEGVHWSCRFIPIQGCPSDMQRRVLIHIHMFHCPGGVFQSTPEAYTMNDDGSIKEVSFEEWKSKHVARMDCHDSSLCPKDVEMLQASVPITYAPSRKLIENVLNDDRMLEYINGEVGEAFGFGSNTLYSSIIRTNPPEFPDQQAAMERPSHHIMDLLVIDKLASPRLYVICSRLGTLMHKKSKVMYAQILGRIVSKQISEQAENLDGSGAFVFVPFTILPIDHVDGGACISCDNTHHAQYPRLHFTSICMSLTRVFSGVMPFQWDKVINADHIELSKPQSNVLDEIKQRQFSVLEGPPGSGKTLVAQHLCETLGKSKSVYVNASPQVSNMVRCKGKADARCVRSGRELIELLHNIETGVKHIVIDDAHNMRYDCNQLDMMFNHIDEKNLHLHIFQDSKYHNFTEDPEITFKEYLQDVVPSVSIEQLYALERSTRVVGAHLKSFLCDIACVPSRVRNRIECKNVTKGVDVLLAKLPDLHITGPTNGLLEHVKLIVRPQSINPSTPLYEVEDIVILTDHEDTTILTHELKQIRDTFTEQWPESNAHGAEIYPPKGIIIDSLESFMGLEARVIVFVLPRDPGPESAKSLTNPKYKIAIVSRGIERVDFVKEGEWTTDEIQQLKPPTEMFERSGRKLCVVAEPKDELDTPLTKVKQASSTETMEMENMPKKSFWSLRTELITDFALTAQTGQVILCHPKSDSQPHHVSCVTLDGEPGLVTLTAPTLGSWSVCVNRWSRDLVMACRDMKHQGRFLLAHYKAVDLESWSSEPTQHQLPGKWTGLPHVVWMGVEEAVLALCDSTSEWWLVAYDVMSQCKIRKERAGCDVREMTVSPKGNKLFVHDYVSVWLLQFKEDGVVSQKISLTYPAPGSSVGHLYSLCPVGGDRFLACHQQTDKGRDSVSVTLWGHEGRFFAQVLSDLPFDKGIYRIRVDELKGHLLVCSENMTRLTKFDIHEIISGKNT